MNEQKIVAGIDLDLKGQSSRSCGGSSSSSSKSDCPSGSASKGPEENAALKQVTDAIEQTIKDLEKELREIEPGSANTQTANAIRGKINKAKQYLGYWAKIRAAKCLPPEIPQLIKRIMAGDDSWCTNLCDVTSDWFNEINPSPNEDYQKKLFKEFCLANCGSGSKKIMSTSRGGRLGRVRLQHLWIMHEPAPRVSGAGIFCSENCYAQINKMTSGFTRYSA